MKNWKVERAIRKAVPDKIISNSQIFLNDKFGLYTVWAKPAPVRNNDQIQQTKIHQMSLFHLKKMLYLTGFTIAIHRSTVYTKVM